MKNTFKLIFTLMLGACVYSNPVNYEKLYSTDLNKIDWSKVDGEGSSCQTNWFFGLIPFGDNSVASAVANAEISKIAYVDTDTVIYIPGIMYRDCTNVWGELTPSAKAAQVYSNMSLDKTYEKSTSSKTSSNSTKKSTSETKPATVGSKSENKSDYGAPTN